MLACACFASASWSTTSAHADEPNDGTRAVRREAMASVHETRAWLRAKNELQRLPREIADLHRQLDSARLARGAAATERVAQLEDRLAAAEAKLARIQAQFGPLVQAMNELAEGGV